MLAVENAEFQRRSAAHVVFVIHMVGSDFSQDETIHRDRRAVVDAVFRHFQRIADCHGNAVARIDHERVRPGAGSGESVASRHIVILIVVAVEGDDLRHLFAVGKTSGETCPAAGGIEGREQDRREDGDDGDDHQQLDQREAHGLPVPNGTGRVLRCPLPRNRRSYRLFHEILPFFSFFVAAATCFRNLLYYNTPNRLCQACTPYPSWFLSVKPSVAGVQSPG